MKRSTVIAMKRVLTAIVIACATVTAFAPSASAEPAPEPTTVEFKSEVALPMAKIARSPEAVGVTTDPPMGGCQGRIQFNTEANYVEYYLVDSKTQYYGDVVCTATGPNQAMAELSAQSDYRIDDQVRSQAEFYSCYDCLSAWSTSTGYCLQGPQKCWGTYTARVTVTMLLPDGWYWPQKPWDGCVLFGGQYPPEAYCEVDSTPAEIPYVYSG